MKRIGTALAACSLTYAAQAAWQVTETKEPLTDKRVVRITTPSTKPVTQFNRPFRPSLVLECAPISDNAKDVNKTALTARLQFTARVAVLEVSVRYQFDQGAATALTATVSDNGDAIFLSSEDKKGFLNELRNARHLRMEVGLRASPVVVEFDTTGAAAAMANVPCGAGAPNTSPLPPKAQRQ